MAAGHASHAVAADAGWYDPGAHASHAARPSDALNVPGEHAMHCSALTPPPNPRKVPMGQR